MVANPPSALDDPLDGLAGVHTGLRGVCALLERLAGGEAVEAAERRAAADFLRGVLAVHLRDEEEDLFPLLRRRCTEEDEIGLILSLLGAEHDQEAAHAARVADLLERDTLTPRCRRTLLAFAREQRQHVAIEDGVVLPMARLRLGRRDLATLRAGMAARRAEPTPNLAR